jgi:hypothetical protein
MIQDIPLCRMMTEIRDFQDGQDSGILADAPAVNLTSQPFTYSRTACLARGNPTARDGKGAYGLCPRRPLEQPCSEEGHNRIRSAPAADRDSVLFRHVAQLRTARPDSV